MSIPTAAPSNLLTLKNTTPPAGEKPPPSRFILFGRDWLELQTYIQQAMLLPINTGDWDKKYGAFPDKVLVTNALDAMTNVHNLASEFGDPSSLKRRICEDGNYLLTAEPPSEIYGHIVWLATQIENAASTFTYTLANLAPLLSPTAGTPEERAANLKLILVGDGGLVSTAEDMKKKTADLLQKLTTFDGKISEANKQILTYVTSESKIMQTVNQLIGKYKDDIDNNLKPAADAAYKSWRDYTIAAVTTSVGITILTLGILWPVGLGLGIGLGVAAANQMKIYNRLMDDIKKQQAEIAKKTRLKTDLTGLNGSMSFVAPALKNFKSSLETIEGVWVNIGSNLAYIVNNYGVEQLSSLPWVTQAMRIGDATHKWQDIKETAQHFTQHSLVSYDFSVQWGQKIPEAA